MEQAPATPTKSVDDWKYLLESVLMAEDSVTLDEKLRQANESIIDQLNAVHRLSDRRVLLAVLRIIGDVERLRASKREICHSPA